MALLGLALLLTCASAHRVHRVHGLDERQDSAPSEEDLRSAALKSWAGRAAPYKAFALNLDRHSNMSIFEQTRSFMEDAEPRVSDANWTGIFFSVKFKNENGTDAMGLRKEWLTLVMQSIVMPENHAGSGSSAGLQCLQKGTCGEDAGSPQYLLKALPSGDLVPINVDPVEDVEDQVKVSKPTEPTSRVGALWNYANSAYDSASETLFGPAEPNQVKVSKPTEPTSRVGALWNYANSAYDSAVETLFGPAEPNHLIRFQFLGKWLARAYIISGMGYAPLGFHSLVYKSLLAGHAVEPENEPFYNEEDTIPACEKVAAIVQSRSPQQLRSYGWLSCDEIKDPETGKYTQPSCYTPIYKDENMWEALYTEWGPLAPDGAKADDLVPFSAAREFTELQCEASWKSFEDPVNSMVKGFRKVIPGGSDFWKVLNGNVQALRNLIEGNSDVDLDELWEAVSWDAGWFEDDWPDNYKKVLYEVFQEMQKEGEGLPPVKRPLNKLLHFFTGSFKKPVQGWKKAKVEFVLKSTKKCVPLIGKTCFNELRISEGCLDDPQKLKEMIAESVVAEDFAYD